MNRNRGFHIITFILPNHPCKITFGWLLKKGRRWKGMSIQMLFLKLLLQYRNLEITFSLLEQIENDVLEITNPEYDQIVDAICEVLEIDKNYAQEIRNQTLATA
ncbi:MAG TPA: hypothetical protein VK203_19635 [Nostocaceae cyanobacterium]|nr:hypothetical protein [Nostocaceae cyanobacterium]